MVGKSTCRSLALGPTLTLASCALTWSTVAAQCGGSSDEGDADPDPDEAHADEDD